MSEINSIILILILASTIFSAISIKGTNYRRLELKIDMIMKHFKIDIKDAIHDQVRLLLSEEKKIHAIKLYREATGLSLREAKEFVENLEREM